MIIENNCNRIKKDIDIKCAVMLTSFDNRAAAIDTLVMM